MSQPSRIALVGFMGSGKSTVGRLLAAQLGYRFVDTDEVIETRAGSSVAEIFERLGEPAFRDLERTALRDLLREEGCVIATGGGAFVQPGRADDIMSRSFTVYLSCEFEESFRRASSDSGRPLLQSGKTAARALYAERKDKYAGAHVTVDTTHRSPDEAAADVLRLLPHPRP